MNARHNIYTYPPHSIRARATIQVFHPPPHRGLDLLANYNYYWYYNYYYYYYCATTTVLPYYCTTTTTVLLLLLYYHYYYYCTTTTTVLLLLLYYYYFYYSNYYCYHYTNTASTNYNLVPYIIDMMTRTQYKLLTGRSPKTSQD